MLLIRFQLFFASTTILCALPEAEKTATASTAGRAYLQARCVS
jgi:hypothetical protein